ncbi:beta-propeller fold lactonase family protein [Spirosoma sp. BT702]|uniref:Beta-propeller fold lactonase family protein n=1 Tax=Spirosoma profusum TaxID=2771354 RepID=A0A927GA18_9BACT|nr:beta-propeller fold lactonase family protein [Spirosoma profusum]MBD2704844.1 beta-propeller fold lactonase family protein [Spirosoma profusum]
MNIPFTFRLIGLLAILLSSLNTGWAQCSATVNAVSSQTVCAGSVVAAIPFSGSATSYQWTNSNPAIGLAANGTGNLSSFTAINNSPTTQTALITVTPRLATDLLYMSTFTEPSGNGTLHVFDPVSNTIITSIPVGRNPIAVSVRPDKSRVYVANASSSSVSVINMVTNTVIATITVGLTPYRLSVSPNGNRVYVTNTNSDNVSVIDAATNTVIATIPVGDGPRGVVVSPNGGRVYVANHSSNSVSVIDAATNTVISTIPTVDGGEQLSMSPDGSRLYVPSFDDSRVYVIDAVTNTVATSIFVIDRPYGVIVSPDGSRVYASTGSYGTVRVINAATNTLLTTIAAGDELYGMSLNADGSRLYVADYNANEVKVINIATNAVVSTSPGFPGQLGGNWGNFIKSDLCSGDPISFTITVPPAATATLTASTNPLTCANPTAILTATGTDGDPGATYQFSGPGILASSPTNSTALVNVAGDYSVIVTSVSGCSSTATVTIGAYNSAPDLNISPESAILTCFSPTISLKAINSDGFGTDTYRWSTGATTASISVSTAGPYSVTLTGANGCTATATRLVDQEPSPTVNPVSSQTVCAGSVVSPISFSGTAGRYQWTNSNPGIGLPASGTGNLSSFTAINNTPTTQTAIVTVTPQSALRDLLYLGTFTFPSRLGSVNVYDPVTDAILTSIPVGKQPRCMSISPDGSRAYVTNYESHNISVIDVATSTVIATIPVGDYPNGISVSSDGSRVYVANNYSHTVSVINTTTNSITASVPVGDYPNGVSVSPDGSRVYVTHPGSDIVSVINTAANSVTATIPVGGTPVGVSVSPDGSRVYVVNNYSHTVSVINTAANSVTATIPVGDYPLGMSVSPDGSRAYVANNNSYNVSVINTVTNAVTTTIAVGDNPIGVSISPDGSRVYVTNSTSNNVSIINTATNQVENTSLSFPNSLAGNIGNFFVRTRCSGTPISFTITVPPTSTATLTASTTTLTCANPTATLTATGTASGPGTTYQFSGPGILASNPTSGAALVNTAGTYSVTVTSANGCTSTATLTIGIDNSAPALSVAPASATLTCASPTVSLSAAGTGTYRWSTGAATSVISASIANTYSVTLTGTNGCSSTAITTVIADQTPPSLTLSPSTGTPTGVTLTCTNPVVSLSAIGTGTYRWSTGATTSFISVSTAGIYSATLTGSNGCSSTASINVTIDQNPPSISISPANATLTCATTSVSLTAVGTGTYRWNNGATTSAINATLAGTYSVTLTGTNGCTAAASTSVSYQNCAPTLVQVIPPQSAIIGDAFSYVIPATTFTDAESPNSLSLSVIGLPSGLSFVSPNTISGTPSTTLGTPFSVTVVATDPGGLSVRTSFLLIVQPRSFAITGVTMLDCNHISYYERRINFMVSFEAINGQPISLSVVNEVPTITIHEPYQLNLFTDNPVIVLKARQQGTPGEATFAYNWLAHCANGNPRVENPIPPQSVTLGQSFSYTLPANAFTDAETPNSLILSVIGLPAGLSFVSPFAIIGTVSASTSAFYSVTVTATDPVGGFVSTILPLSIVNPSGCGSMFTLKAGNWNDVNVWSCGRIPLITDVVTLNHAVSLPPVYQAQALRVTYSPTGRLLFGTNSRLRLSGN